MSLRIILRSFALYPLCSFADCSPNQARQTQQMSKISIDPALFSPKTSELDQLAIAKIVHSITLPFYKEPMPQKGYYLNKFTGLDVELTNRTPSYHQDHLERIAKQEVPARDIHGTMHAARVTLWTQVLARMYEHLGREKIDNTILLAAAGSFHDVARESEGKDHWDKDSSLILKQLLGRANIVEKTANVYVKAIEEKDPDGNIFSSDVQRIVHDADSLDIIRVIGKNQFNTEYLCFYTFDLEKRDLCLQLIAEVARFIFITEDIYIRTFLEHKSEDFYGDIIRLLFALQKQDPKKFPLITELIKSDMKEILASPETEVGRKCLWLVNAGPISKMWDKYICIKK